MAAQTHAAVIVGTGFSGMGAAILLEQAGIGDVVLLEKADGVGGTWRHNTYPGCACDVPSHLYSFSFAPNPEWTRDYAPQPEILAYLEGCADRFGLRPKIRLNTSFEGAVWDEQGATWSIQTSGEPLRARSLILAAGPMHHPRIPELPGKFDGPQFHSATWDPSIDLRGKRVAVVGTGASAIQVVPAIQPMVKSLTLFQRTPAWILPRRDQPVSEGRKQRYRTVPGALLARRTALYWRNELRGHLMTKRPGLLKLASRLATTHLEAQIDSPQLRQKLTPSYVMGCKRILLSDDFYPAVNQPNVELLAEEVSRLEPDAVVTPRGARRSIDVLIWATGFHITDALPDLPLTGREGLALKDAWERGPEAYLGGAIAGFPNLSMLLGPNTGLGHNSMVFMIEAQLNQVVKTIALVESGQARAVEVKPGAQKRFNERIQQKMAGTVWATGCRSWYVDPDGVNRTVWPDSTWRYWLHARRLDRAAYAIR